MSMYTYLLIFRQMPGADGAAGATHNSYRAQLFMTTATFTMCTTVWDIKFPYQTVVGCTLTVPLMYYKCTV